MSYLTWIKPLKEYEYAAKRHSDRWCVQTICNFFLNRTLPLGNLIGHACLMLITKRLRRHPCPHASFIIQVSIFMHDHKVAIKFTGKLHFLYIKEVKRITNSNRTLGITSEKEVSFVLINDFLSICAPEKRSGPPWVPDTHAPCYLSRTSSSNFLRTVIYGGQQIVLSL